MNHESKPQSLFSRPVWTVIGIIGIVGLIFLLKEHTNHVFSVIPYLILLACPFMHIFMHGGHGKGHTMDK